MNKYGLQGPGRSADPACFSVLIPATPALKHTTLSYLACMHSAYTYNSSLCLDYSSSFLYLASFRAPLKRSLLGPGWVAHLVRASSQYAKVVGSIPSQDTYHNQLMNAWISVTTHQCFSLSLKPVIKIYIYHFFQGSLPLPPDKNTSMPFVSSMTWMSSHQEAVSSTRTRMSLCNPRALPQA